MQENVKEQVAKSQPKKSVLSGAINLRPQLGLLGSACGRAGLCCELVVSHRVGLVRVCLGLLPALYFREEAEGILLESPTELI